MSSPAAAPPSEAPAAPPAPAPGKKKPTVLLIVGMAGSGKSTLMQRIRAECAIEGKSTYAVNLDPAVATVPYACNIDIRDTVNYKKVMQQYDLGPNGAIVTSLNLFATRFDQVLTLIRARVEGGSGGGGGGGGAGGGGGSVGGGGGEAASAASTPSSGPPAAAAAAGSSGLDYVLIDTPGQIEVFAWSASGALITSMISEFPTVLVFVVDTPRVCAPNTFMANMLYATSVLYKAQLPFVLAFNKCDAADASVPRGWMTDLESFQDALDAEGRRDGERAGYISSLMRSLGWALDSFYGAIRSVSVSAATGEGMEELFAAARETLEEDERDHAAQQALERAGADAGAGAGAGQGAVRSRAGRWRTDGDGVGADDVGGEEEGGGGGGGDDDEDEEGGGRGAGESGKAAQLSPALADLRSRVLREALPSALGPAAAAGATQPK